MSDSSASESSQSDAQVKNSASEATQKEAPVAPNEIKEQPAAPEQQTTKPASTETATTSASQNQTSQKARAALQGVWGSFSAFANRVVHAVEAEADSIKSEQQALKKEAALEKQPPPAKVPPWLDLGPDVTDEQRGTVLRMIIQLTSSSANFLSIPITTQKEARQAFVEKHAADGEDLTPAEKKHVANTEEDPEKDGFTFVLNAALPSAEAALNSDAKLARMRNALVPRRISERNFWRNYLWRVYVIKTTNGITWPTPGIIVAKGKSGAPAMYAPTGTSTGADANGMSSTIEDEITMALDELDDDKTTVVPTEHDDSWTKEVEEALADKP